MVGEEGSRRLCCRSAPSHHTRTIDRLAKAHHKSTYTVLLEILQEKFNINVSCGWSSVPCWSHGRNRKVQKNRVSSSEQFLGGYRPSNRWPQARMSCKRSTVRREMTIQSQGSKRFVRIKPHTQKKISAENWHYWRGYTSIPDTCWLSRYQEIRRQGCRPAKERWTPIYTCLQKTYCVIGNVVTAIRELLQCWWKQGWVSCGATWLSPCYSNVRRKENRATTKTLLYCLGTRAKRAERGVVAWCAKNPCTFSTEISVRHGEAAWSEVSCLWLSALTGQSLWQATDMFSTPPRFQAVGPEKKNLYRCTC